jgi:hypothetical protein
VIIFVDIDGTICRAEYPFYELAEPIPDRISYINRLFAEGNRITYYTARGSAATSPEHKEKIKELTLRQLESWGCLFHELRLDKPLFHLLLDDRAENADKFFEKVLGK